MANQVIVTNTGNVQVALTPPANVQVQISRAAIGTVSNVPTANFANYAGNVTASNQPNITSLGTLTTLSATGTATFGNVIVTGNLQVGNLVANNANFANFAGEAFNVSGSNVTGAVANATYANAANTANLATFATTANAVAGANVSGTVANANYSAYSGQANTANLSTYATTANSVALANVSGAGNIASINLDGNVANLLTGNGTFVAIPTVSANANYANFAGTAFNVSGSNVSGAVANATFAANAGNANIANTANSVAVANVSGIGNIATVNLDGNASNILYGNGAFSAAPIISNVANANFANFAGTAFSVSGSNVSGEVANAAYSNAANTANLATYATTANAVAGANVSGTVANATFALDAGNSNLANTANSVAVANVLGIGNIATTNYDGNTSNVLYGNGGFYALPTVSNVANANYANFAGTAFSVSGSNVSGAVANATYANDAGNANLANTANSATVANSANSVAVANVSGIGNIATVNLDGNASNILYGNGVFATTPIISNVANANYANFAGEAFNVNASNITGTVANANYSAYAGEANTANLATFATTANAVAGANVSGTVANATFALDAGNANLANLATYATTANSVAGANVSGEVANANFASYSNIAASANSVALANVVGIGNIANINLDGSSSNVLFGNGVFAPESTSIANANYANFAGNLINGTSNISIPTASSNILISTNGNANVVDIRAEGSLGIRPPAQGPLNALRIETYGRSGNTGAQRISSFRFRGNSTTPLSVEPGDYTMEILTAGSNGTALQTNSLAFIRGQVGNSYTANSANIPLGWQVTVNDTNGGINNQGKTHNFYSNGNVSFANVIFADGGGLSNIVGANVTGQVPYAAVANSVAVANVSGIGNIATINLDGNVSNVLTGNGTFVAIPNASANANYANFAGNLINGTSNISIPIANGTIAFSVNNTANLVMLENGGFMNTFPTSSVVNMLRINTFGNPLSDAHRIAWARARGSNTSPTSVQGGDNIGSLSYFAHNGANYQTNSVGFIRGRVDSSYTANGANIPIGFQITVNDTNGGINNQSKTHNFFANGTASFASSVEASSYSASGNIAGGNLSTGGTLSVSGNTSLGSLSTSTSVDVKGNNSTGVFLLNGVQFSVIQTEANGAAGYAPFFFRTFQSNNDPIPAAKYFRAGNTIGSPSPVSSGSNIWLNQYAVYADSGNTYKPVFEHQVTVTGNDGAGNVTGNMNFYAYNSGSNINLQANTYATNVSISSGGFMKLASYTAAALTAITGQVGWMAAVTNSGGGGNPNGMIAFWDTTNARWSYIHDNSAV
jgi:hypothetical protein